jgi:hypothetical protein
MTSSAGGQQKKRPSFLSEEQRRQLRLCMVMQGVRILEIAVSLKIARTTVWNVMQGYSRNAAVRRAIAERCKMPVESLFPDYREEDRLSKAQQEFRSIMKETARGLTRDEVLSLWHDLSEFVQQRLDTNGAQPMAEQKAKKVSSKAPVE